jgi:hypothetical protein
VPRTLQMANGLTLSIILMAKEVRESYWSDFSLGFVARRAFFTKPPTKVYELLPISLLSRASPKIHPQFDPIQARPVASGSDRWPTAVSIGISPDDWKREFPSSRFCLAIRGDTPQSCSPSSCQSWLSQLLSATPTSMPRLSNLV